MTALELARYKAARIAADEVFGGGHRDSQHDRNAESFAAAYEQAMQGFGFRMSGTTKPKRWRGLFAMTAAKEA